MQLEIKSNNNWLEVKQLAFRTIGKDTEKEPTSQWKTDMLLCQHSPIRSIVLTITMRDIPYWVSVHLTRHKYGVEHYVKTQRTDRTGVSRDELPQGSLVDHTMIINAEAMINISKKRLCRQASPETKQLWNLIVKELIDVEPELAKVCVPDCIYRGKCFEFKPCGYSESDIFKVKLQQYRELKGE